MKDSIQHKSCSGYLLLLEGILLLVVASSARYVGTSNGSVNNYNKNTNRAVRAFLRV